MNRYPLWKYIVIALALAFGLLYTLPNFFAEVPAVQISSSKSSVKIDTALLGTVEETLKTANVPYRGAELDAVGIKVRLGDPDTQLKAKDVLQSKLIKRGVPVKNLDIGEIKQAGGDTVKREIKLKMSLDGETAKKVVAAIKDAKMKKVQASIQGEQVRITSPSKDELQDVMTLLRGKDASLHCDGQSHFALVEGDRVVVRRAAHRLRLLHPQDHDHFAMLRQKLHWSETPERLRP